MNASNHSFAGISRIAFVALALLLASCVEKSKPISTFKIGGTVSGLTGTGLVLQNNGGDNLAVAANGAFTFSKPLNKDASYSVKVLVQPTGQTCTVTNGSGTVTADVTNVAVNCVANGFTVGGTVSGLAVAGLVLQNNGGNNLTVSANGVFTFSALVAGGAGYSVTVLTQPAGQTCSVANGSGTIAGANVTNVAVNCVATGFTVGGTVSGLAGTGLVLQNNGGNNLPVSANGVFTFPALLAGGAGYSVTVLTQPTGQICSVANGSGTIAGANVTNVAVTCVTVTPPAAPSVNPLGFGVKELRFSWAAASGATFYRLLENPDGVSGFAVVATNIATTSFNHFIPVHRRLNASYKVEACNAGGCTASAAIALAVDDLTKTIGYVKASNTQTGDELGYSVALSGDGNTLAVGAMFEDSGSTGVNSTPNEAAADAGAVYVYAKIAGSWSQQAYVKASNTQAGDQFGYALALSDDGNTLAVSAKSEDSGSTGINSTPDTSAVDAGAVYVFIRSGGNWSQQAYVKASNPESNDQFGSALALSGDGNTLAVGAMMESSALTGVTAGVVSESTAGNDAFFAGAVYVYTRSGGNWSQQAYVKASNTESVDLFGSAVALSGNGNTLVVGAPFESSGLSGVIAGAPNEAQTGNASTLAGAAYVYTRSGTTWAQQAYVKASNTIASNTDFEAGAWFGNAVAVSSDGNTFAASAPHEASSLTGVTAGAPNEGATGNASADSGAVYVYTRAAGAWSQQAYVKASNTGDGDNFGSSLALSGDGNTLAVGAPFEDSSGVGIGSAPNNSAADAGAVYVYTRSGATWSTKAFVKASNTTPVETDAFGNSVALSGDGNTLAVGAPHEDGSGTGIGNPGTDGAASAGAAYLY